jgi:integrase
VAREWYAKHTPTWAPSHADRILRRFERDVFPWIGGRPVGEIVAPDLLAVARRIEERGALETAHRALQSCGQVFRYAVATGRADRDPTGDLRGALPPAREGHFPAVTEPTKVGDLLRAIEGYRGTLTVRVALRLAPPGIRAAGRATQGRKLRVRLGWPPGISNGNGPRPKYMHWDTYWRLLMQYSPSRYTHLFLIDISLLDSAAERERGKPPVMSLGRAHPRTARTSQLSDTPDTVARSARPYGSGKHM